MDSVFRELSQSFTRVPVPKLLPELWLEPGASAARAAVGGFLCAPWNAPSPRGGLRSGGGAPAVLQGAPLLRETPGALEKVPRAGQGQASEVALSPWGIIGGRREPLLVPAAPEQVEAAYDGGCWGMGVAVAAGAGGWASAAAG